MFLYYKRANAFYTLGNFNVIKVNNAIPPWAVIELLFFLIINHKRIYKIYCPLFQT